MLDKLSKLKFEPIFCAVLVLLLIAEGLKGWLPATPLHVEWSVVAIVLAVFLARFAAKWLDLKREESERDDKRVQLINTLNGRFDEVEKTARDLKIAWVNNQTARGR